MRTVILAILLALTVLPMTGRAQTDRPSDDEAPWWRQTKIVFMWGQWNKARVDRRVDYWIGELPREHFRRIARAGGTVFAEAMGMVKSHAWRPAHAHHAHEFGLKYFATRYVGLPRYKPTPHDSGRKWVSERGDEPGGQYNCTLEQPRYEHWMVEPLLAGIQQGLIDGIFVDWENYGGNHEAGICYCDDCFSRFLTFKDLDASLPDKAGRYEWLHAHDLVRAYRQRFHERRFGMFTAIRQKLHAVNPDLIFASYDVLRPSHPAGHGLYVPAWDYVRAMQTPRSPHLMLDPTHYNNDDRQPWWQSYAAHLRHNGVYYIPGSWTNALFGAQASQVSAARWIYEASIHEDGCWLWFERELDDEILRAYATADRRIKTVQHKVGRFLFRGARDPHFATLVEWAGRPALAEAVLGTTYHLGDEHLVHVTNVDDEWPLRVRVRIPQAAGGRWTVRDALADLHYTRDGTSPAWTAAHLREGVVVAMAPRSDLFLLLAPQRADEAADPPLVHSRNFTVLPGHASASSRAGPVAPIESQPGQKVDAAPGRLVFTATVPMGFEGKEGGLTIGNAIHTVNADGSGGLRLRQLRGHLWSPRYAPDGRKIAFVHDTDGRGQIHLMSEDGSNVVKLSDNAFCDRAPVWSPDGSKIAFLSDRTGDWDVFVMNAYGSNQHKLAGNRGLDRAPAWSPDGRRIAWESHVSGIPAVWVCDADGSDSRPLIDPNGTLAYHWADLWATGAPVLTEAIERTFPDEVHYLTDPAWSPDGKRISAIGDGPGRAQLVVAQADGSSMVRVNQQHIRVFDRLVWSPDGTCLAGNYRAPRESERAGIFVFRGDRKQKRLDLVEALPQSPRLGGARRHGLMTWYTHGSALPRRVVKTFTSLAWSPDGQTLAFSSDMDPSGAFYVYTVPAEGGELRRLDVTRSAWPNEIAWR